MEKTLVEMPESILDVGIGFGKYGVLLREALDIPYMRYEKRHWLARIDGIEAFPDYRNPLHDYVYNTVYYMPVGDCLPSLGLYDVVLMVDVLEHFEKHAGMALLKQLVTHARKALIISTPVYPAPQESYLGNTFEAHRSRWTAEDFSAFHTEVTNLPIQNNTALIVKIFPA